METLEVGASRGPAALRLEWFVFISGDYCSSVVNRFVALFDSIGPTGNLEEPEKARFGEETGFSKLAG